MKAVHPSSLLAASVIEPRWAALIPDQQWNVFCDGTTALARAGVEFRLHGALALAHYTGRWRDTKDVDVIIRPAQRAKAVAALQAAGFADYFEREAYDRSWIFRGWRDGVIFDVIWELPNHRVVIDDAWLERATTVTLRGRTFGVVPLEEFIRVKLYVFQRERCDWVDVLNVLAAAVGRVDWEWLLERLGRDEPLLHGALAIFEWLCPGRARRLPNWVRTRFALSGATTTDFAATEERRVRLLDSRPWFGPHQPDDRPLER